MRILVTGATGFIGRYVVAELLSRGHEVVATSRSAPNPSVINWGDRVTFVASDMNDSTDSLVTQVGEIDGLFHLAWPGLPNYQSMFHLEENVISSYQLIDRFVDAGCPRVLVTGTCFEYGMREGVLSESLDTNPSNPYGLAKDSLRRWLQARSESSGFGLCWARLFYMHGVGQNPRSLLAQLDTAIARGDREFNMSGGEQLRDYLPVVEVSRHLVNIFECQHFAGLVNVCSGTPISVRRLVEQQMDQQGVHLKLNLGHYPYPEHEPFAFWGDPNILSTIEEKS